MKHAGSASKTQRHQSSFIHPASFTPSDAMPGQRFSEQRPVSERHAATATSFGQNPAGVSASKRRQCPGRRWHDPLVSATRAATCALIPSPALLPSRYRPSSLACGRVARSKMLNDSSAARACSEGVDARQPPRCPRQKSQKAAGRSSADTPLNTVWVGSVSARSCRCLINSGPSSRPKTAG